MTSKEALEIIIKENKQVPAIYVGCRSDLYTKLGVEFDIVREDLEVLKIIKEKYVDIWNIKSTSTVEQYNRNITNYDNCDLNNLSDSEYKLMKRWLKND